MYIFYITYFFMYLFKQKEEKRQQHAMKETEFLRLKRSRLGVHDFEPLKVIGRGAFGEVMLKKISLNFTSEFYFLTGTGAATTMTGSKILSLNV